MVLKVLDLQANGELAQTGAYLAGTAEALDSNTTGDNILLLHYFCFLGIQSNISPLGQYVVFSWQYRHQRFFYQTYSDNN